MGVAAQGRPCKRAKQHDSIEPVPPRCLRGDIQEEGAHHARNQARDDPLHFCPSGAKKFFGILRAPVKYFVVGLRELLFDNLAAPRRRFGPDHTLWWEKLLAQLSEEGIKALRSKIEGGLTLLEIDIDHAACVLTGK